MLAVATVATPRTADARWRWWGPRSAASPSAPSSEPGYYAYPYYGYGYGYYAPAYYYAPVYYGYYAPRRYYRYYARPYYAGWWSAGGLDLLKDCPSLRARGASWNRQLWLSQSFAFVSERAWPAAALL
jgi:hypothetical protein